MIIERVTCFPNDGDPEVIPGDPVDGDIIRITDGDSVTYRRYYTPVPPAPVFSSINRTQFEALYAANGNDLTATLAAWPNS